MGKVAVNWSHNWCEDMEVNFITVVHWMTSYWWLVRVSIGFLVPIKNMIALLSQYTYSIQVAEISVIIRERNMIGPAFPKADVRQKGQSAWRSSYRFAVEQRNQECDLCAISCGHWDISSAHRVKIWSHYL